MLESFELPDLLPNSESLASVPWNGLLIAMTLIGHHGRVSSLL